MAIINPLWLTVISIIKAWKQGNIKKPNNLSFGSVAATAVLHSGIHMLESSQETVTRSVDNENS